MTPASIFSSSVTTNSVSLDTLLSSSDVAHPISTSTSVARESISGLVAGSALTLAKSIIKYPLDTATVRLQISETPYSLTRPLQLFRGAYRGISGPLLINIPAGAVFFAIKDASQALLQHYTCHFPFEHALPSIVRTSLAVALAQIPYWWIRNPIEVVKCKQQCGIEGYGEGVLAWQAINQLRRDAIENCNRDIDGFDGNNTFIAIRDGFYVGYWENIFYAYPADVIKFVCYDVLTGGRKDLSPFEGAWVGAFSASIAQWITTPLDVIRNRIMANPTSQLESDCTEFLSSSSSYMDRLIHLASEEGLRGCFAGAVPRVGKAILSGAIQFATYEETKHAVDHFIRSR